MDHLTAQSTEDMELSLVWHWQTDDIGIPPSFRCRLNGRSEGNVHVYAFYCNTSTLEVEAVGAVHVRDTGSAVRDAGFFEEEEDHWIAPARFHKTIPLSNRRLADRDTKVTDYLLLFLSSRPADMQMLAQRVWTSEGSWFMDNTEDRNWNATDWEVVRIPVHLSSIVAQRP